MERKQITSDIKFCNHLSQTKTKLKYMSYRRDKLEYSTEKNKQDWEKKDSLMEKMNVYIDQFTKLIWDYIKQLYIILCQASSWKIIDKNRCWDSSKSYETPLSQSYTSN